MFKLSLALTRLSERSHKRRTQNSCKKQPCQNRILVLWKSSLKGCDEHAVLINHAMAILTHVNTFGLKKQVHLQRPQLRCEGSSEVSNKPLVFDPYLQALSCERQAQRDQIG
eukprot:3212492-Amphidinium_carterae.1